MNSDNETVLVACSFFILQVFMVTPIAIATVMWIVLELRLRKRRVLRSRNRNVKTSNVGGDNGD